MTTTNYPMSHICKALDLLITHEVISDDLADHSLGEWLNERGLTSADLNAEPERATTKQQLRLAELVGLSFESDPADVYTVLASHFTSGFEADATKELIEEYTSTMDLN